MEDKEKDVKKLQKEIEEEKEKLFSIEEIKIEEMAIDGICGVY